MSFGMPSLGSATGTRVDSAAKHIMACKMDDRLLAMWRAYAEQTSDYHNCLHNSKMKWCMNKDEIVLNTSKKYKNDLPAKAYPMVVTTIGDMHACTKKMITELYKNQNASSFFRYLEKWVVLSDKLDNDDLRSIFQDSNGHIADSKIRDHCMMQIKNLPEFRCQGIALGQAFASYLSGDTVASVLIGGMATVQNGAFAMHAGDLVQWYFDWEKNEFDLSNTDNGGRLQGENKTPEKDLRRKQYNDQRLFGTGTSIGSTSGQKIPDSMVRIKSYRMFKLSEGDNNFVLDHFGDKSRIFAKCISGGRPYDAVDIMLMTQSL